MHIYAAFTLSICLTAAYDAVMTFCRRNLWLNLLAGLILACAFYVWWVNWLWVSASNGINVGMTRGEVLAITGRPSEIGLIKLPSHPGGATHSEIWQAVDGLFVVAYDDQQRVVSISPQHMGFVRWQAMKLRLW
jgi:hypothetical protein